MNEYGRLLLCHQADEQIWSYRPMHSHILDSLAKTASYLNELRKPLLDIIMQDFYIAVDSYVKCIRDLPESEHSVSQVNDMYERNNTVMGIEQNCSYEIATVFIRLLVRECITLSLCVPTIHYNMYY